MVRSSQQVREMLYLEGYTPSRSAKHWACVHQREAQHHYLRKRHIFLLFSNIFVYVSLATGEVCRCMCCHFSGRHPVAHALGCLNPLFALCALPLVSLLHHFCYHEVFFLPLPTFIQGAFSPWVLKVTRFFL